MNRPPRKLVDNAPAGTVWFGGPVDLCKLTLRVYGNEMVPKDVSASLGCKPTESWARGDPMPSGPRFRKISGWLLGAPATKSGKIDAQIDWIFSRLTRDMRVWRRLGSRYRMDLNAVIYLESWNRGLIFSPSSMAKVSRRGLSLGFDIYFYGKDGQPKTIPVPPRQGRVGSKHALRERGSR